MPREQESMRTKDRLRSKETMQFVKVVKTAAGETFVMRADLPVGRGYNEKGQPMEYINLGQGWRVASEYDAEQNSKQAAAKREEAAKVVKDKK